MTEGSRRIAENPSFAKLRQEMKGARDLVKLRPLLRLLGIKISDDLAARLGELETSFEDLSGLPDRFNDLFAGRGWIAYEQMHAEVMRHAIELGEAGDLDGAEDVLVEHYDQDTIDQGIKWLFAIEAFRPRERLARLALEDYAHGRYHACIPVVLMILDGVVNDVHGTRGFFYQDANLTAWDSISAHSRGLQALHKIFAAGRQKTTTEPISVPYRHGILHGQDLGYDNRAVAAKTWAALFAIRDWALAVRDGRLKEPPAQPEPPLLETLEQLEETKRQQQRCSAWAPRSEEDLAAIPASGAPDDYDPSTPEAAVAKLLDLWRRRNYGEMAKLLPPSFRDRPPKAAGTMRQEFGDKQLDSFEIVEIRDEAPAISEVRVDVRFLENGRPRQGRLECRVICHSRDDENTACRGDDGASWFFWPRLTVTNLDQT